MRRHDFVLACVMLTAAVASCAAAEDGLPASPAAPSSELERLRRLVDSQKVQLDRQERRIESLERKSDALELPHQLRSIKNESDDTSEPAPASIEPGPDCWPSPRSLPSQVPIHLGGQYRILGNASNFPYHPVSITDDQPSFGFANQRFRTWLTVAPNEHVEGYLQVEMGHILLGQNLEFPKTYVGPRFPPADDRVGIELRRGYLTFQTEEAGRFRVGIQDWTDAFGQTLASADWDFNVGGVTWLRIVQGWNDLRILVGAFFVAENDLLNDDNAYLFTFDLDQPLAEHWSTGISAYCLPDRFGYSYPTVGPYRSAWDNWLGWRLNGRIANLPWNTFLIWNFGERENAGAAPRFTHSGAATKLEVGPVPVYQVPTPGRRHGAHPGRHRRHGHGAHPARSRRRL